MAPIPHPCHSGEASHLAVSEAANWGGRSGTGPKGVVSLLGLFGALAHQHAGLLDGHVEEQQLRGQRVPELMLQKPFMPPDP